MARVISNILYSMLLEQYRQALKMAKTVDEAVICKTMIGLLEKSPPFKVGMRVND